MLMIGVTASDRSHRFRSGSPVTNYPCAMPKVRLELATLDYKPSALAIELYSSKAIAGKELSLSRNIYSNHNQVRAYVECSPDQSKKITLSSFPSSNRRNFEDSGKVLAVSVSEFHQSSITVQLYQPTRRRA